ncbi:MAG: glycolate oxidase subunit GlcF [Proteobacteria bacterium]|jgi:glycolate oxidase iron-sulfur subunit|nr:glycolate oxidase subunit GlcF [Pseudomonadota bacterium]
MEIRLAPQYAGTPQGEEAEAIVRTCVHCGFCLATCPTYQLLGDELDSPRGRIYLMKQVLEGAAPTAKTQLHLDRCLTCRSCETTCPSGVRYGRLVDIGRRVVEERVARSPFADAKRAALRRGLLSKSLFGAALSVGRYMKAWLPAGVAASVPDARPAGPWPAPRHARRVLIMKGCVQPALAPDIDAATARVLDRAGISAIGIEAGGCCGAVSYHLSAHDEARAIARRNVDAWWPEIERGAEAIVVTASGCGVMLHEYDHLLAGDAAYAEKGRRIAALARDPAEIVRDAWPALHPRGSDPSPVAFHSPCTLQHGLAIRGLVERILADCGYRLTPVADAHLCCGSAGTYSLLQPALARQLKSNKLHALEAGAPQTIATANIGCLTHLQSGTQLPVRHWIELVDRALA